MTTESQFPKAESKHVDHDSWFRAKVREALDDPRPAIPHEQVKAYFAKRRAEALRKERM